MVECTDYLLTIIFLLFRMAKYKKWREEDLAEGMAMIKNGSSLRVVEKEQRVPRSTLHRKSLKGK